MAVGGDREKKDRTVGGDVIVVFLEQRRKRSCWRRVFFLLAKVLTSIFFTKLLVRCSYFYMPDS